MKTIGLLGGMSWESSSEYYSLINQIVRQRLGGHHSAKCVLVSVDFAEIEALQQRGDWDVATELMILASHQVERAGADFLVICTNTMHKMADQVQAQISIPLVHIVDATAGAIAKQGLKTVGLLGTRFTMEEDFYRGRLESRHGVRILVPEAADRQLINRVIYDELVLGVIKPASRQTYLEIIQGLVVRGAQGVILGCTEIGLLVKDDDTPVPLFDTTEIHATAAVDLALEMD